MGFRLRFSLKPIQCISCLSPINLMVKTHGFPVKIFPWKPEKDMTRRCFQSSVPCWSTRMCSAPFDHCPWCLWTSSREWVSCCGFGKQAMARRCGVAAESGIFMHFLQSWTYIHIIYTYYIYNCEYALQDCWRNPVSLPSDPVSCAFLLALNASPSHLCGGSNQRAGAVDPSKGRCLKSSWTWFPNQQFMYINLG